MHFPTVLGTMLSCLQMSICVLLQQKIIKSLFLSLSVLLRSQHILHSRDVICGQLACSPFSSYLDLLFELSWQDPAKVQIHCSLVRALCERISLAVFPLYTCYKPARTNSSSFPVPSRSESVFVFPPLLQQKSGRKEEAVLRPEVPLYVSIGISYKIGCAFSKEMSYSLNTCSEKVLWEERWEGNIHRKYIPPQDTCINARSQPIAAKHMEKIPHHFYTPR